MKVGYIHNSLALIDLTPTPPDAYDRSRDDLFGEVMSWHRCTHLACLLTVLMAPVIAQARLAEQIGESLAEMSELVTLEVQTIAEVDVAFTVPELTLPGLIDLVVGHLPYLSNEVMLLLEASFIERHWESIPLPSETASQRHARLQVFRF